MEQMKSKPTGDAENSDSDVEIVKCFGLNKPKIWVIPSVRLKSTGGATDTDSNVKEVDCFGLGTPTIREKPPPIGKKTPIPSAMGNVTHIPLPLVTPPWSSADTEMPVLTSLLSGNHPSINIPPDRVLYITCYLCQKPFYDVDLLKEHLAQHSREMYLNSVQPQVTGQQTVQQPFLKSVNVTFPSEQPTYYDPPFNNNHVKKRTLAPAEKYFECPICKIRLNSRKRLEYHHSRVHPGGRERPFVCLYCKASYKCNGFLLRHLKFKHNFDDFAAPKETAWRMPSPCSSAASTSESNSTETSTGLFSAEPAVDYYPNSGELVVPRDLFNAGPAADPYPTSEPTTSTLQSPSEQLNTRVFEADPAVDYYTTSEEFLAPRELFNAEPSTEFCRLSESITYTPVPTLTETSTRLIKAEPGVDSESPEELAAKAAAYYCPPAKWAAMGLPFGNGYFIPMDPNKIYPLLQEGCAASPEFDQWISEEDMEKYKRSNSWNVVKEGELS